MQSIVVALVVSVSFAYALWTLSPKALRRRLASKLLTLPHPHWLKPNLVAAASQKGGCGCDGCDRPVTTQAAGAETGFKPLVFQRRAASVFRPEANQ